MIKRVFMLSCHPLFSQGVETLLRQEPGLELVGREMDVEKALERIKELRPDVVILDSSNPKFDPIPGLIGSMRGFPGITVIGMNLTDNRICVFRWEEWIAQGVQDLTKAINAFEIRHPINSADKAIHPIGG